MPSYKPGISVGRDGVVDGRWWGVGRAPGGGGRIGTLAGSSGREFRLGERKSGRRRGLRHLAGRWARSSHPAAEVEGRHFELYRSLHGWVPADA